MKSITLIFKHQNLINKIKQLPKYNYYLFQIIMQIFPKLQKLQDYDNAILKLKKVRSNLIALREFETQICIHQQTMSRLNRAAQM